MKSMLIAITVAAVFAFVGCDRDDHAGHGHAVHEGHDDHEGEHGDGQTIRLSAAQLAEFDIQIAEAAAGTLSVELRLPGEIAINPDRVVHVAPRVPGVVRKVNKSVGDKVRQGDVLAILDSRELARLKAEYLASTKRHEIARANFEREKKLFEGNITPESQYLAARQAVEEAAIQTRVAERELHAVGLSEADVEALSGDDDEVLTRYEMTASIDGAIIERHITRGEVIPEQPNEPPFVIADFSNVWVHLTVYPKDLDIVRVGQPVTITSEHGQLRAEATIAYISPSVNEATRSATARVVLDNTDARWRPGLFVTGIVQTAAVEGAVVVNRDALQTVDGKTVLFMQTIKGFEPQVVTLGRSSSGRVEITDGIKPGQRYAATNTFTLKAELNRAALEHAGHVH